LSRFPAVKAFLRHRIIVIILGVEFALIFALLTNAIFLGWERFEAIRASSGLSERNLLVATPHAVNDSTSLASVGQDAITTVRSQANVEDASEINQTPFSGTDHRKITVAIHHAGFNRSVEASEYFGDIRSLTTLGVKMSAGRWFDLSDYMSSPSQDRSTTVHVVVLSKAVATKLFKSANSVGENLYLGNQPATVVGIMDRLARPGYFGADDTGDSIFLPELPSTDFVLAIRIKEGHAAEDSHKAIEAALNKTFAGRIYWTVGDFATQRSDYFSSDEAAFRLILAIFIGLLLVSANAIVASSHFWVIRRKPQVAIRRALGATRSQVITSFLFENAIIGMFGIIVGAILASAISLCLSTSFGSSRLPSSAMLFGALLVFAIGQCGTLYPAFKMGRVSPALAMRL